MSQVLAAIKAHALSGRGAPALASADSVLSYAALDRAVAELAAELEPLLCDGGGAVALKLDNGIAWVLLDLALIQLGRASLPLPGFFHPAQIKAALDDSGADWLISDDGAGRALSIGGEIVFLRRINGDAARSAPKTAKISYTSGSTGAPKGVCLSLAQMERVALSIVSRFGEDYAGVHMPILPMSVLLENVAGLYAVLFAGGLYRIESAQSLGCSEPFKPDFECMSAALQQWGASSFILVPELLRGQMALRALGAFDTSRVRLIAVGGAKLSPDLIEAARGLGFPVFEGYGLTECASVVAVNAPQSDRLGSVGKPLEHVSMRLSSNGEIIVKGPSFLGYTGDSEPPDEFDTGDIGFLDEGGFLHIEGRKKNLIITSFGRNVAPEWIESELTAEPLIRHAIVFGDGEAELRALISPLSPNIDEDALIACVARANQRLPAYARIGDFKSFSPHRDLHFTGAGKLRRNEILAAHGDFTNGCK